MSQAHYRRLDPASQAVEAAPLVGSIVEFTTDGIAASERLSYWRDTVLRRMVPIKALSADRPFQGRLRRIIGADGELIEHASDAILAVRDPRRCRADGCDDISIDLMLGCTTAKLAHGGERHVRADDLCVVDYSRPVEVVRSRHQAVGIILSRQHVREALGHDPSVLAGYRLPAHGIGALLRSHMRLTLEQASQLSAEQRVVAIKVAVDMALVALAAERGARDADQHGEGVYRAARALIERDCANPSLTPELVAMSLGCSRASLYRAFFRHGESVAAVIWTTRLEHARRLLGCTGHRSLPICEIAFRSGFLDQATFNRMFKRRFGMTPGEARAAARHAEAASLSPLAGRGSG